MLTISCSFLLTPSAFSRAIHTRFKSSVRHFLTSSKASRLTLGQPLPPLHVAAFPQDLVGPLAVQTPSIIAWSPTSASPTPSSPAPLKLRHLFLPAQASCHFTAQIFFEPTNLSHRLLCNTGLLHPPAQIRDFALPRVQSIPVIIQQLSEENHVLKGKPKLSDKQIKDVKFLP